ncbi:MAG: carbohydrate ABC transporter permease, partial [bacterium]|nr:carbohydrate ABC transporter permease [bacterium]
MATTIASQDDRTGIDGFIYAFLKKIPTSILWLIVMVWSLPTVGIFVNSFRSRDNQRGEGWWQVWNDDGGLTFANYDAVFDAKSTNSISDSLLNSFAIAIPATVIPIAIAAFAAYAFAWIDFKGRKWLFIATVSLLAIPLQVALIPLLKLYIGGAHLTIPLLDKTITLIPDLDLVNTTTAVWLTHAGFALPFAIFLLHNYISGLPRDVFEAARIDGADHFTIFWRLVLPLSVPVLAAFGIFQFLWTWN